MAASRLPGRLGPGHLEPWPLGGPSGQAAIAVALLDEALAYFANIGSAVHELETKARRLELELWHGYPGASVGSAERLLEAVHAGGGADALEAMVRRLLGIALAAQGDLDAANAELNKKKVGLAPRLKIKCCKFRHSISRPLPPSPSGTTWHDAARSERVSNKR